MSKHTVLIVTQPFDVTADYVVTELHERGVPVFRCNPGDLPHRLTLTAHLGKAGPAAFASPNGTWHCQISGVPGIGGQRRSSSPKN